MINSFKGKYDFLSNFHPCWVEFEGCSYPTSENAYQAAKTTDTSIRLIFQDQALEPSEAKRMGRRLKLREDWEQVKIPIMREILKFKFSTKRMRSKLLETGEEELVEGNWWGDTFWGVCNGKGENHLGKLLMEIREELHG